MKIKLIALCAILCAVAAVAVGMLMNSSPVGAQTEKVIDEVPAIKDGTPFIFNGYEWKSKDDFLENGRCTTKKLSEYEIADIERELSVARENRKEQPGYRKCDRSPACRLRINPRHKSHQSRR